MVKRYTIFILIVMTYGFFRLKEYPIDWADRYDAHHSHGSYGDLGDSGGYEEEED